jgi:cellulose synthase/poly-beta-1,6-N-acetylglucosamine synthase-like glycosyltransferase
MTYILEIILLSYFGYVSLYSFIFSTAGLFYRPVKTGNARIFRRFAVLIPAYKEDQVITAVAEQALLQDYPSDRFDVIVIADSLQETTLQKLRSLPIIVVEVSFEKSTKVKALNRAMATIGDSYDCAMILDADNVMEEQCLRKINKLFEVGYRAVQARRDAKNQNTEVAVLDGLSEAINNFIYRRGNIALGLSCPLIGSGMAFDYSVLKPTLLSMDSVGGFDRELELRLLSQGIHTHFAQDIVVFDEKVANQQVFEHQRRRWMSSHLHYLREYFREGWRQLFRGNFSYFNSAVLRNIQLPRLLNLGLLVLVVGVSLLLSRYLTLSPWVWIALLGLNALAILFAIPKRFYNIRSLKSIALIPKLFGKMFLLLFRLKNANKTFLHTPHSSVEMIENESTRSA